MSSIDVQALLSPIDGASPCGPDLEYDPAFGEMERSAQGTTEQQFGDTVVPGEPSDWVKVRSLASDLAQRTKDLRVVTYLARGALATQGIQAFRDAITLLDGYVDLFWDTVHPLLDPDDDNDPTIRVNAVMSLVDPATTIRMLRETSLVRSRAVGQFSHRDYSIAKGEMPAPPEMGEPPSMANIEAAVQSCDLNELKADADAVEAALTQARQIEAAFGRHIGASESPNLDALTTELAVIHKLLRHWLNQRGYVKPGAAAAASAAVETSSPQPNGSPPPAAAPLSAARNPGQISSREEAIAAIEQVCRWFERYEPSSPLPLLLRRAKRLSTKSFLEILRDISPGGVDQAQALSGTDGAVQELDDEPEPARAAAPRTPAPRAATPASNSPPISNDDY